jgi:hypothetical protein
MTATAPIAVTAGLVPGTREAQLSQLLGCTIAQLDISPEDFRAAERRYDDLAAHLADEGADVFVQGSVGLGTVIAPYGRWGEYDLDLVCLWRIAKRSITQARLKERVGELLDDYLDETHGVDGETPRECSEGRRSWTLHYARFHMDVLPAIPDTEALSDTAIELTDKQLRMWQKSDPQAYVTWFRARCAPQFLAERKALAASAGGTVEDVPAWRVRTPLHRVVQVLKRHRDVMFANDCDDKPPSSLITTLAARAYAGQTDLLTATLDVVEAMPRLIERRGDRYWVENPVCDGENFADKWNDYPQRRRKFINWYEQVARDLEGALHEHRGAPAVHDRLKKAFGTDPVNKAIGVIGDQSRRLRESGGLQVATRGLLTEGAGRPVRDHRFFGGPAPA